MLWDFCHVPIDEAKLYGVVCFQSLPKNKKNIAFYLLFAFYLKYYLIHNIQKFKLSKLELYCHAPQDYGTFVKMKNCLPILRQKLVI